MSDLTWAHVVRDSDRRLFKRCRRQWDLGARARRNLEPAKVRPVLDLDRALHAGLAVYYFPGMWEWDRAVVRRLARAGYSKSVREQWFACDGDAAVEDVREWRATEELGAAVLDRYFEWAPTVDAFTPVRVETDFEIDVPDPARREHDLTTTDGRPVRFRGRIDMLVVDEDDVYWIVQHRTAVDDWADLDELVLDEDGVAACWAWELFFLGMRIAGVVYNELGMVADQRSAAAGRSESRAVSSGHRRMYARPTRQPRRGILQEEADGFRRTTIPRSRSALDQMGEQLALEVLDMTDPDVRPYPHPTRANCAICEYRRPCIAMNEGTGAAAMLDADYRPRGPELEEGRLGGVTWSMNRGAAPPRFGGSRGNT